MTIKVALDARLEMRDIKNRRSKTGNMEIKLMQKQTSQSH